MQSCQPARGAANDDELELARRAQRGDADAFTALVDRHQDRIYRLAWRMVGADSAEDVAQQAFLKAWLGLGRFHGEAAFGTWLYRLAMNCCLDHRRREHRFRPLPLPEVEPVLPVVEDVAEAVVEALELNARRGALVWALECLADQDRLLLHLRVGEGLSYEAIAELLQIKPSTVGTRLFRARARLHGLVIERIEGGARGVR